MPSTQFSIFINQQRTIKLLLTEKFGGKKFYKADHLDITKTNILEGLLATTAPTRNWWFSG
jgi:hypothetical protein